MREDIAQNLLDKVRLDYDAIADDFSATRSTLWPEMERFCGFVKSGNRVLDVGCGNGRAYQLFDGMAIEYEGIDVSAKLIEHANAKRHDVLTNFRVGSILALPYSDQDFDVTLAVAMLHHIPSRQLRLNALREVYRVLKPGGHFLMTNWDRWKPEYWKEIAVATFKKIIGISPYDFKDIFIAWKRGVKSARGGSASGGKVWRYYHAFTKGELHELCRTAGFEVVEQYYTDREGKAVQWWNGKNLVTICRKIP